MRLPVNYSTIKVIYNPQSTGEAPRIARQTALSLRKKIRTRPKVELVETRYAGHAEKLAQNFASRYRKPLIISVSGDGGYHEVVNGVMKAKRSKKAHNPVVTVVGAGNANDHYRTVVDNPLPEALGHEPKSIDLLEITVTKGRSKTVRYAHSYAGLGITPRIAQELNAHKLNPIKEIQIILRALIKVRPVKIEARDKTKKIESLLFTNIHQMAKVLTMDSSGSPYDGKFEIVEVPFENRLKLFRILFRAATIGLKDQPRYGDYSLKLLEDSILQTDGEIIKCEKNTRIHVGIFKDALVTLI